MICSCGNSGPREFEQGCCVACWFHVYHPRMLEPFPKAPGAVDIAKQPRTPPVASNSKGTQKKAVSAKKCCDGSNTPKPVQRKLQ